MCQLKLKHKVRFEGHTGVFLVDVGYPLEDEIAEATKILKLMMMMVL